MTPKVISPAVASAAAAENTWKRAGRSTPRTAAIPRPPRNFDVPAFKTLAVLFPDLNTRDPNNPEFVAAQQLLGEVQSEAQAIVLAQPGVKAVNWELDREWVARHHIDLPAK